MQKRPSSRTGGSARVDGVLRYRSQNEGVLCSARCRELSRTGLTATIERPVFPGDLLRFDLEPASGGRSVSGLARVAWTGRDPEGPQGTSVMRIRFLSIGDMSEHALLEWLDELSDVTDRPSSPLDDSSVRALGRAIADSLLPPPPVLPGAPPSTEPSSSGLTPAPVALPNRPSIPPPPGLYARGARDLTHSVENVGKVATSIAPPMPPPSTPPPKPASVPRRRPVPTPRQTTDKLFPHPPSLFAPDAPTVPTMPAVTVAAPAAPPAPAPAPAAKKESPARRSADVRERLSRLQKRRGDETPLTVPTEAKRLSLRDDAPAPLLSAPPVALSVPAPLPLGALLHAPLETTRRSTPPPPGAPPPALGQASSSSWPALRVPPAVAAMTHEDSVDRPSRATIPPPAEILEMPPLRVASPALEDDADRVEPPHLERPPVPPRSDAPWSVPVLPARGTPRPWLALCLASLAAGAAVAYLVYGPALRSRGASEGAAAPPPAPTAVAVSAASHDETLEPFLPVPGEPQIAELNAPEPQNPFATKPLVTAPPMVPVAPPRMAAPLQAVKPKAPGPLAQPALPAANAVAAVVPPEPALVAVPVPEAKEIEPGDKLPPPAPELPAALGGHAAASNEPAAPLVRTEPTLGSRLDRARACLAQGDIPCATELLKSASTEAELELWIETLRAEGNGLDARRAMKRFVETYPEARRAAIYRRILSNAP